MEDISFNQSNWDTKGVEYVQGGWMYVGSVHCRGTRSRGRLDPCGDVAGWWMLISAPLRHIIAEHKSE